MINKIDRWNLKTNLSIYISMNNWNLIILTILIDSLSIKQHYKWARWNEIYENSILIQYNWKWKQLVKFKDKHLKSNFEVDEISLQILKPNTTIKTNNDFIF